MILQLNPAILVETPLGRGEAIFVIDYGMHQNTCWVVALQKDGVIKHFDCNDVLISTNYTYRLNLDKKTTPPNMEPLPAPRRRSKKKTHD
jgi:hypothetical protein